MRAALLLMAKYDRTQNQAALGVISYRFLHPEGPFRLKFQHWAEGKSPQLDCEIFTELMSYACALTSMQRLEGRHARLKKVINWRSFQSPASLSAAMRRKQNRDLSKPEFQAGLADFLSKIGDLHTPGQGPWASKTQLLESFLQSSQDACHDSLDSEQAQRQQFKAALAQAQSSTAGAASDSDEKETDESPLQREHVKAAFRKGGVYCLKNCVQSGMWSVFRVLHTAPGGNMYMQRACYMSTDVAWLSTTSLVCVCVHVHSDLIRSSE